MSPIYVPGKVTFRQTYIGTDDPDAAAYIAAVEAADEIASPGIGGLETATKVAIHSFVKGCKNDGIWPAIKASCILAGARTLDGALVPLVGPQPTTSTFVSGDYNRKTGIAGNGTKVLSTGKNVIDEPQNSYHQSLYLTSAWSDATNKTMIGGSQNTIIASSAANAFLNQNRHSLSQYNGNPANTCTGFIGHSRNNSANYNWRDRGTTVVIGRASLAPPSSAINALQATAGFAFYSIGESLDLELLDTRVTDLINAFGVAIP